MTLYEGLPVPWVEPEHLHQDKLVEVHKSADPEFVYLIFKCQICDRLLEGPGVISDADQLPTD